MPRLSLEVRGRAVGLITLERLNKRYVVFLYVYHLIEFINFYAHTGLCTNFFRSSLIA